MWAFVFSRNKRKTIGKNLSKNLIGQYSQKLLYHTQKIAEVTDDLIGIKIAHKITKYSRTSPQNSLKKVTNKKEKYRLDREIPKEIYISPHKRH